MLAADQLAVAHFLRRVVDGRYDAARDGQTFRRDAQSLRGTLDEDAPSLRRSIAQRARAVGHAEAAGRAALVARVRSIAHQDVDPFDADIELLGDDLGDRDIEALAHVHLAEE